MTAFTRWISTAFYLSIFLTVVPVMAQDQAPKVHALAMHGTPKYAADFTHFDYVNPAAPKGGTLTQAATGGFDTLHPFIVKGDTAPGLGTPGLSTLVYQSLMTSARDEPFTMYGDLAKTVSVPEDRSAVTFYLHPEARWHDGAPLTAADVVWSYETLKDKGHPFYLSYYKHVKQATALDQHTVRFDFDMTDNMELPLIMGQMPVLPKHWWTEKGKGRDFTKTSLDFPLGSGPYRVKAIDPGRKITYERVTDWWAAELPVNKGRYNFDTLVYDMYLDVSVQSQALFSGAYDVREENIAKAWHTQYENKKPVQDGRIKREVIPHSQPAGMQGFVFNIRRPVFQDRAVREAINHAFDFEWSNKKFAFGTYTRSDSYFENSDLAARGLPSACERTLLDPHKDVLMPEVLTKEFKNPKTDGSGRGIRKNLSYARKILKDAGWTIGADGILEKNGQKLTFEFLSYTPSFTRWVQPLLGNLKRLGIEGNLRIVDTAQYQNRLDSFDFDMTITTFAQSLSPGNEQYDFWGSEKADLDGSRNLAGIKSPVVDDLIQNIIRAKTRDDLVCATRALDRVLLWGWYVIPNWHINAYRLAYWDRFSRPAITPKYGLSLTDTWWYDPKKAQALKGMP